MSSSPTYAVRPGIPSTPRNADAGTPDASTLRAPDARVLAPAAAGAGRCRRTAMRLRRGDDLADRPALQRRAERGGRQSRTARHSSGRACTGRPQVRLRTRISTLVRARRPRPQRARSRTAGALRTGVRRAGSRGSSRGRTIGSGRWNSRTGTSSSPAAGGIGRGLVQALRRRGRARGRDRRPRRSTSRHVAAARSADRRLGRRPHRATRSAP